jgi:lipopolysaccharide biosynthesis protein
MENKKYNLSNIQENKLVISLNNDYLTTDNDEVINAFIQTKEKEKTNKIVDYEKEIYEALNNFNISFFFLDSNRNQINSFVAQNFYKQINNKTDYSDSNKVSLIKSFFRLDFYNSTDPNTSILLDEIIVPVVLCEYDLVLEGERNSIKFYKPFYTVTDNKPMKTIGISFNELSQISNNKVYIKATFFNSRTGRRVNFINSNVSLTYGETANGNVKFDETFRYHIITINKNNTYTTSNLNFYQEKFI